MKHYNVIAYGEVLESFDTLDEAQDFAISISQGYRLYRRNYLGYNNRLRSILKKLLIKVG